MSILTRLFSRYFEENRLSKFLIFLQPVSSSEDKSSKLQRRKHQIGTLLHDMKARQMELLDRRVKGSLTKAETQAKYGW